MADERLRKWNRDGFFVVRQLLSARRVAAVAAACDHVLEKQRANSGASGHTSTHVSGLFAPEFYEHRPDALELLVTLASSPQVVGLISDLGLPHEGPLNLRDLQYFHEPSVRDYDGDWHRDGDTVSLPREHNPSEPRPSETLLRFRIACAPDDHLEYNPGSHRRDDTPQELQLRRGAARNTPLETGSVRIALEPGDVCIFNTRGIHRARYRHSTQRRTLDLLYRFGTRKIVFSESVSKFVSARFNK